MMNLENANQTKFAFEEPIFSDMNVDLPVDENADPEEEKKSKKKIFIIAGVVIFLLFLLLMIFLVATKKPPEIPIFEESEMEVSKKLDPFERRIENAKLDLEIADPANQDLTFPPVDMKLRLDEKKRR